MRVTYLLLIVCLSLVSAKYLPNESASTVLLRRQLRSIDDDDSSNSSDSSEDRTVEERLRTVEEDQENIVNSKENEEQRKQLEKREERERKRVQHLEKENRKRQEQEQKRQEKLAKEERKRQEKLEKEERKRQERIEKQERKREEKLLKHLKKLEEETVDKDLTESAESSEDNDANESIDLDDIWKGYIYQKYGLTAASTKLEKLTALNQYYENELGLNVNSTRSERRQAVIKVIQDNLNSDAAAENNLSNYMRSHINAAAIQKLRLKLEQKINNLNNDSSILENATWPWVPAAKANIDEQKTLMQSVLQFVTNLLPSWVTGPSSNSTTASGAKPVPPPEASTSSSTQDSSSSNTESSSDASNISADSTVSVDITATSINSASSSNGNNPGSSVTSSITVDISSQGPDATSSINTSSSSESGSGSISNADGSPLGTAEAPSVGSDTTVIDSSNGAASGTKPPTFISSAPTSSIDQISEVQSTVSVSIEPVPSITDKTSGTDQVTQSTALDSVVSGTNEPALPGTEQPKLESSTNDAPEIAITINSAITAGTETIESVNSNDSLTKDPVSLDTSTLTEAGGQVTQSFHSPSSESSTPDVSLVATGSESTFSSSVQVSSIVPGVEQQNTSGDQNLESTVSASEISGVTKSVDVSVPVSTLPESVDIVTGLISPPLSESSVSDGNISAAESHSTVSSGLDTINTSSRPIQVVTESHENALPTSNINVQDPSSESNAIATTISLNDSVIVTGSNDAISTNFESNAAGPETVEGALPGVQESNETFVTPALISTNGDISAVTRPEDIVLSEVPVEQSIAGSSIPNTIATSEIIVPKETVGTNVIEPNQAESVDVTSSIVNTSTEKASIGSNINETPNNVYGIDNSVVTGPVASSVLVQGTSSSSPSTAQEDQTLIVTTETVVQDPITETDASVLTSEDSYSSTKSDIIISATETTSSVPSISIDEGNVNNISPNNDEIPSVGSTDTIPETTTEIDTLTNIDLIGEPQLVDATEANIDIATVTENDTAVNATTVADELTAQETNVTDLNNVEATSEQPGIVAETDVTTVPQDIATYEKVADSGDQVSIQSIDISVAGEPEVPLEQPAAEVSVMPPVPEVINADNPAPKINEPDVNAPINSFIISPEPGATIVDVQMQQ